MLLGPGCEGLQGSLQGVVWGGKHSPPPPGATPQRQDWAAWHVPTASGQASFCAVPAPLALTGLATLLSTGWHLLSVVPLPTANMGRGQSPWQPQTGTTVTGAMVRVELAWHMGLVPCAQSCPRGPPGCCGQGPSRGGCGAVPAGGLSLMPNLVVPASASQCVSGLGVSSGCIQGSRWHPSEQSLPTSVLTYLVRCLPSSP